MLLAGAPVVFFGDFNTTYCVHDGGISEQQLPSVHVTGPKLSQHKHQPAADQMDTDVKPAPEKLLKPEYCEMLGFGKALLQQAAKRRAEAVGECRCIYVSMLVHSPLLAQHHVLFTKRTPMGCSHNANIQDNSVLPHNILHLYTAMSQYPA